MMTMIRRLIMLRMMMMMMIIATHPPFWDSLKIHLICKRQGFPSSEIMLFGCYKSPFNTLEILKHHRYYSWIIPRPLFPLYQSSKILANCTISFPVKPNKLKNSFGTFATLFSPSDALCTIPYYPSKSYYHAIPWFTCYRPTIHHSIPCQTILYPITLYQPYQLTQYHRNPPCPPLVALCACKFMSSLAHILFHPRQPPCFKHGPSECDFSSESFWTLWDHYPPIKPKTWKHH